MQAGVYIAAAQPEKLERLCRYVSRPPVAGERLTLSASGILTADFGLAAVGADSP